MVRATIAVPSVTQIPKVLAEMKKAGIELAQQPKNNLLGEGLGGSGYRDLNMIVKLPNGMLAELQAGRGMQKCFIGRNKKPLEISGDFQIIQNRAFDSA
jgi:hypothetical protein